MVFVDSNQFIADFSMESAPLRKAVPLRTLGYGADIFLVPFSDDEDLQMPTKPVLTEMWNVFASHALCCGAAGESRSMARWDLPIFLFAGEP